MNSTNVRPFIPTLIGHGLNLLDRLSPAAAESASAKLFLTPRRPKRPDRELEWLSAARRFDEVIDGMTIPVWAWGQGPSILLLHGWEGRGSQLGAFGESVAGAGFTALAPDFPAHGSAPGRRSNLIEFAAVIRTLVQRLRPSGIIAHSFGTGATTVALRDIPYRGPLVYLAPPETFTYFTRAFSEILGISRSLGDRMQSRLERRFGISWEALRGSVLAPRMESPLLIFHDDEDDVVPVQFGTDLARAWPRAELVRTSGLGHRRLLRDPDVVRRAVDFVTAGALDDRAADRRIG